MTEDEMTGWHHRLDGYLRDLRRSYSVLCASFAGGSGSKEFACNVGNPGSVPVSGRSPGGSKQLTPVLLPGESHGQRSLVGYSPWGRSQTQPSD